MITGASLLLIGVIFGAMGAHALKDILTTQELESFQTAVRYQMYHGLGILILANKSAFKATVYRLMLLGVILFSGSIYLLVLDQSIGMNLNAIGFITPIGGLFLIVSWTLLVINIIREKSTK